MCCNISTVTQLKQNVQMCPNALSVKSVSHMKGVGILFLLVRFAKQYFLKKKADITLKLLNLLELPAADQ